VNVQTRTHCFIQRKDLRLCL